MTENRPEALRWIRGQGEEGSPAPGRCEVSPAGKSDTDLHRLLTEVPAGNIARLDVLRGTERKLVEVVIGEAAA